MLRAKSPELFFRANPLTPVFSILIVDDNGMNRRLLNMLLTKFLGKNNVIEEADNGRAAVDKVENQIKKTGKSYDLIFLDYQMPFMLGDEAAKEIRNHELKNNIFGNNKSFIVTFSTEQQWSKTPYPQANALLRKEPVRKEELENLLNKNNFIVKGRAPFSTLNQPSLKVGG